MVLHGACGHTWKETPAANPVIPVPPPSREVLLPEGYEEVLILIEDDKRSEALDRLKESLEGRSVEDSDPDAAAFELAAALLLGKTDLARLKAFKESFQRYAESLPPNGAGQDHAERIARLLNERIQEADRKRRRTKALYRLVEQQEKALEDLEYKLQKLEEIQQETEMKREDFLHK